MEKVSEKDCQLSKWDVVDYLDSDEAIAAYLEAAAEENNPEFMVKVINDVARARGVNELAKKMGISREGLYKSLNGKTKPRWETIYKALHALGLQIRIEPIKKPAEC